MNRTPDPLTRWLEAERLGLDDDAEAALLELFEALPAVAPAAGFADRVLLRVEARPARSWGVRAAVAACVLAVGLSLLWLPQALAVLAGLVSLGDLARLSGAAVVEAGRWLGVAARVGEWLLLVGGAFATALTTPTAARLVAACLVLSSVSFVVLRDLMTRDRSWSHVESIR